MVNNSPHIITKYTEEKISIIYFFKNMAIAIVGIEYKTTYTNES